jgi:predicted SAM-dependent methyltransferase
MYVATHPRAHVYATDIYDDKGLTDTMFYASSTGQNTLHVVINDVRNLPFPDQCIDKVFSISVLEHVFPARGGDMHALKEIARVLRPSGIAVVTLPFSKHYCEEYRSEDIYERKRGNDDEKIFYQRHHSDESLQNLFRAVTDFEIVRQEYICERFFHWQGKELCTFISEGNKLKRLSLAPLYSLFGFIFLKRSRGPIPSSEFMTVCLSLRRKR